MIGVMPLEVMCDRWDVGGLSTPGHPDTMQPTIFIYDGFEGGIGLTEKGLPLPCRVSRLCLFAQVRQRKQAAGQESGRVHSGESPRDHGLSRLTSVNLRETEDRMELLL